MHCSACSTAVEGSLRRDWFACCALHCTAHQTLLPSRRFSIGSSCSLTLSRQGASWGAQRFCGAAEQQRRGKRHRSLSRQDDMACRCACMRYNHLTVRPYIQVVYREDETTCADILHAIEDTGFEAHLTSNEPLRSSQHTVPSSCSVPSSVTACS